MKRSPALEKLRQHRAALERAGARALYLFGSVARDEADDASDVDLLVDPASETFTIFDMIRFQDACSEVLGARAEVHDYQGYERLAQFRDRVEKDIVRVF